MREKVLYILTFNFGCHLLRVISHLLLFIDNFPVSAFGRADAFDVFFFLSNFK
jgi:hypothetical protein